MLSDHQSQAAAKLLDSRGLSVLCGGPGCGKTFTVAHLIESMESTGGHRIAVCAPTGKAALRLSELFAEHGVKMRASTIHSLLGVTSVSEGGFQFAHGPGCPLPISMLVIDEFSMVSTPLARTLFQACALGTRVICVGDVHQLPPVEHGAPLRDMLRSGKLPVAELTEVRRNSGRIVEACREIRERGKFNPGDQIDINDGENLLHIETGSSGQSKKTIQRMLCSVPSQFDPLRDVQLIVSLNEKGNLARQALNDFLREFLNPAGQTTKGCSLRVRDKVICTKNTKFTRCDENGKCGVDVAYVANGEMGQVIGLSDNEAVVKLDGGGCILAKGIERHLFDLAYAITVHKSQGSQWPIVIYASDEYGGARRVSCRELIYTAISRAKTLCVTVGRQSTIQRDLWRVSINERKTFLKEMICDRKHETETEFPRRHGAGSVEAT